MPRRRSEAGLEPNRRAELLRAAARLFVERGFDATTTRDIAEAVGMRSGSPFYHFRSKQELLKAAMIEGLDAGNARLRAAIEGIVDPDARAEIAQAFDRYQVPWQQALDELEKAGMLASAAPPVRLLLFGMLNWSSHWYRADGDLSVDQLADAAVAMLLRAPRAETTNGVDRSRGPSAVRNDGGKIAGP